MIRALAAAWLSMALTTLGVLQSPRPAKIDDPLAYAIVLIDEGDHESAIRILEAVTLKMKKSNPKRSEFARAHLYLGVAYFETDLKDEARANFREAYRRDPSLKLKDTEFSLEIREAFEEAKTQAATPQAQPSAAAPAAAVAAVSPETWITVQGEVLELRLAHAEKDGSDQGVLRVEGSQKRVRWTGPPGCSLALDGGFDLVKAVSLAREAGFVIDLGKTKATFVPAHHAALLGKGQAMRRADLPTPVAQEINVGVNSILATLGRGSSASSAAVDALSGPLIDTTIADVLATPSDFEMKNVRLRGRFNTVSKRGNEYMLSVEAFAVALVPEASQASLARNQADALAGKEVEVSGVFRRRSLPPSEAARNPPAFMVRFHSFLPAEGFTRPRARVEAAEISLEELVENKERYEGKVIRTLGSFRGANYRADLLARSKRKPADWIIKHGEAAVWVTGKQPSGDDFALALDSLRDIDAGHWLTVAGKVELHNDLVYVKAAEVAISPPPSVNPTVKVTLQQGPAPNLPATVIFILPQEFDGAAPDSRFIVQFSNEMNEETFTGRVQLRYAGGQVPTPLPLVGVRYDPSRKAMTIVPGTVLQPGKEVECVLLNGIKDSQGRPLLPRKGTKPPDGAVVVLRYRVRAG